MLFSLLCCVALTGLGQDEYEKGINSGHFWKAMLLNYANRANMMIRRDLHGMTHSALGALTNGFFDETSHVNSGIRLMNVTERCGN